MPVLQDFSSFCLQETPRRPLALISLRISWDTVPQEQPNTQETIQKRRDFVPKLMELNEKVLFGDIWERPGLSKRDRSLITVATLVALYRTNELPFHLARARENGISKDELAELFTHLAFYAGWPSAMTAVNIAMEVLAETE